MDGMSFDNFRNFHSNDGPTQILHLGGLGCDVELHEIAFAAKQSAKELFPNQFGGIEVYNLVGRW